MLGVRYVASGFAFVMVMTALGGLGSAVGALDDIAPPPLPGSRADGVPEHWVVGHETLESVDQAVAQRLRVLPGARLDIYNSTLRFAAIPAGLTGIVAEPGSEVHVVNSKLLAAQPGSFLVHLEGTSQVEASHVQGAARVVVQPRSLTDHVDALVGADLERQVPGWRLARILTNGTAVVRATTIEDGTGPGLVAGVPIQYKASVPRSLPALRVEGSTVRATAGPALLCYATRVAHDPDSGQAIPLLAEDTFSELVLVGTSLAATGQPALTCPPTPQAYALPPRNLPEVPPDVAAPVSALLPLPPAPQATAGPGVVTMKGGSLSGTGVGALLDAVTKLDATGTRFDGLDPAVKLVSSQAAATLSGPIGADLGSGILVTAGTLAVTGGQLGGAADTVGDGIDAFGGAVTVDTLALHGFRVGVAATVAPTLSNLDLSDLQVGVFFQGTNGGSLTGSMLRDTAQGVLLYAATGASISNNVFLDNADPLDARSPNDQANPPHFNHAVVGNTVNGLAMHYVFQTNGATLTAPAGHAVVAHSNNVRITSLDLRHGRHHVHASTDVVLGAPVDLQPLLAASARPELAVAFLDVWQNRPFTFYDGALLGARGADQQGSGNDIDKASLLISRAQALGYTGRYVSGTMFASTPAFLNWAGFTDASTLFTVVGCACGWANPPHTIIGRYHDWPEIGIGDGVWLELDPSYDQYRWGTPQPMSSADRDPIVAEYANILDTNPMSNGKVPTLTFAAGQAARQNVIEPHQRNHVNESFASDTTAAIDVLGGHVHRDVASTEQPTRNVGTKFTNVPDSKKWAVRITLGGQSYTGKTDALYGQSTTVGSVFATQADEDLVISAGGLGNVSRFSVSVLTKLWVGGNPVVTVGPHNPGTEISLVVDTLDPSGNVVNSKSSPVRAAGGYSVTLDIGRTPGALVQQAREAYQATVARIEAGDTTGMDIDDAILPFMQLQGWHYFSNVHAHDLLVSTSSQVLVQPFVGVGITGQPMVPVTKGGLQTVASTPPYIDVSQLENTYARDGNTTTRNVHSFQAGMFSSQMEGSLFTQLYGVGAISTVHLLQKAGEVGQAIYHLDSDNVNLVYSTALPSPVKQAILNAVANGHQVTVHHAQLTVGNWSGVGWSDFNPRDGTGGWLIYGGSNPILGADTDVLVSLEPWRIISGGSATGSDSTLKSIALGLNTLGSSILKFFNHVPFAKEASKWLGGLKLAVKVVEDLYAINTNSDLSAKQAACAGAWAVLNDFTLALIPVLIGPYIFPNCLAWALAGGIAFGLFGLFAAIAICFLIIAAITLIIALLAKYIHDLALEGVQSICKSIV